MTIYVVKPGDSIYTIGKAYGVSPVSIASANQLTNPGQLSIGQSIVIPTGQRSYVVRQGDSISGIATRFGISQNQIIALNPAIGPTGRLFPGQTILIPPANEEKLGSIDVNGYVFPSTTPAALRSALPLLTYLSIFSYEVKSDGSLSTMDESALISLARSYKVAPIMVITNIREGHGFNSDIAHAIFTDEQAQNNLIDNVINTLKQKNYYGLNIDFEYIYTTDRENYNAFLRKLTDRLHSQGYFIMSAVAPKTSATQQGLLYEAHDYPVHGAILDRVILMTYEWGYLAGPPQAVAPLNLVRKVLDYAVTAIPTSKILMGIPNYGYDWALPYVKGTLASTFSNVEGVGRAFRNKAEIKYDDTAQSPYYNYYDAQGKQHIVWFEDARSIRQKLLLVNEYKLAGVSYWTIDRPFPQNLMILNSMYNVNKVIT